MHPSGKISIIGAGSVGSAIAQSLLLRRIVADIILVDIDQTLCRAQVQDLSDATYLSNVRIISGTHSEAGRSDVAIITAGPKHGPGAGPWERGDVRLYEVKGYISAEAPGRPQPSGAADAAANNLITKKASAICYEASRQIILVARKYRQLYGSFRRSPISATHCTLSAALVLLRMAKLNGGEISIKDTRMIEDCLQVLEELSTAWNIAKRIRQSLVKLYRQLRSQDTSAGVESAQPDDERSHPDAPDNAQIPAGRYEGLSHTFAPENPASEMQEFACFGNPSDEMLLDDSLWANPNMNLTLDLLTEDYHNFDFWGSS